MKKIASYILIMCLVGVSAYAGMSAIQETDTFAENALKVGSFPLAFQHSATDAWTASGGKVQSTNKTDGSEGWFSTTLELMFDATVSFEWYVNSENSDPLCFYVDDAVAGSISGTEMSSFSDYSYKLKAGKHNLKWVYRKDVSVSTGLDIAQVKNIYIDPNAFVVSGIARPICESQIYFGNVALNTPTAKNIHLQNIGTEELIINSVNATESFTVGNYSKNITSLQSIDIPITLTGTVEGMVEGKVTIVTNYGTKEVSLKGYCGTISHTYAVATPGSLSNSIPAGETSTITSLKLTGTINETDITFIKINMPATTILDLSEALFNENQIPSSCFKDATTLETIILPISTIGINDYAFAGCTSLKKIILSESITHISSYAFQNCSALEEIALPTKLRDLGNNAFEGCNRLASITIPEFILNINSGTFNECTALTQVVFPDSLEVIGESAFKGTGLTSIAIPNKVKSLPNLAFASCPNLTTVVLGDSLQDIVADYYPTFFESTNITSVTFGAGMKVINHAFYNQPNLTTVVLKNSVTTIGNSAFMGCTALNSINIPSKIRTIESRAFNDCSNLKDITLPDSLRTLGSHAFSGCI